MTACRWGIDGIAGVSVVCWAAPAAAYRPFDGTDADVAEPGEVELEIGPVDITRREPRDSSSRRHSFANYGFAPGLEAVLEGATLHSDSLIGSPYDPMLVLELQRWSPARQHG